MKTGRGLKCCRGERLQIIVCKMTSLDSADVCVKQKNKYNE